MDFFYIVYFAVHIVTTLLIDITIVLPRRYQLSLQQRLHDFHIASNSDFLVMNPPAWFQGFVWIEVLFQTPFFVYGMVALYKKDKRSYPAILIYAVEAAVTTFACIVEVAFGPATVTNEIRIKLVLIYLPTFLIPLYMTIDFYRRLTLRHLKLE